MSKKQANATAFKARRGDHSLTGFSRAFCDILPKNAMVCEIQRRQFKEIFDTLKEEERTLLWKMKRETDPDEKRRINDLYCIVSGKAGSIKKEMASMKSKSWAEVFLFVAGLVMNQENFYDLRDITHALVKQMFVTDQKQPDAPGISLREANALFSAYKNEDAK